MKNESQIRYLTLLLTFVAGYCDTVTFVSADELFSAHVTGNFIVFAHDLIKNTDPSGWMKLLTFPVFIISVMMSGMLTKRLAPYMLLMMEGILLLGTGIIATAVSTLWAAMLVVIAMAIQNTFSRVYSKETFGPTTIMTGNVTQASLDLAALIKSKFTDASLRISLAKECVTIGGFLIGCVAGAISGKYFGLPSVLLPGGVLVACYLFRTSDPLTELKNQRAV